MTSNCKISVANVAYKPLDSHKENTESKDHCVTIEIKNSSGTKSVYERVLGAL